MPCTTRTRECVIAYDGFNQVWPPGNDFDNGGNAAGSHITRWPYLNKAVISNNTFSRPGGTRHAIKLHAPYWNAVRNNAIFDPIATKPRIDPNNPSNFSEFANGDGYSKHIVISDNKLTDSTTSTWPVAIAPQNEMNDERIKDVIVERNWWVATPGTQISLYLSASEVTARNNIFNLSNGSNSQTAILVTKRGIVPPSDQVNIFNNTIYTSSTVPQGQFMGIHLDTSATNISVKNNLAYAPNAGSPVMIRNNCGACLTEAANSTNLQVKNNAPGWATATPLPTSLPAEFKLTVSSVYAFTSGVGVTVYSDFFLVSRTAKYLGAVQQ